MSSLLRRLPPWVLGLPAFGGGLALTVWLGVLPKDIAVYAGIAAAAEMVAVFRRWARGDDRALQPAQSERFEITQVTEVTDIARRDDR